MKWVLALAGVGWVVHHFGWSATFAVLTACVVAAIVLIALVGPEEKRLMAAHAAASAR